METLGQLDTIHFIDWLEQLETKKVLSNLTLSGNQNALKFKFTTKGNTLHGEVGDELEVFTLYMNDYYVSHELAYSPDDRATLLRETINLCSALIDGNYYEQIYINDRKILKKEIKVDIPNKYIILEPRKVSLKSRILILFKKYEIK